jgi:Peptidoglycan-synthase activator LpoB
MRNAARLVLAGVLACSAAACEDKPHEYGQERPPVDQIHSGGEGLQSKDLLAATDQMAMELLALPALNQSDTKWTIVSETMEDHTMSGRSRENYDIFINRLKTQLYQQGNGRIALIENRDRFHDLQNRELEGAGGSDEYGQGSGEVAAPGGVGIQPQYALYGDMEELANRGVSTYRAEFKLTNFKTREIVWNGEYIVNVKR